MTLDIASQVLLIIVSTFLSFFLLLSIMVLIKTYQVLQVLKRITEKAEHIADSAEAVGEFFKRSAGPVALAKVIGNIVDHVVKHNDKKQ